MRAAETHNSEWCISSVTLRGLHAAYASSGMGHSQPAPTAQASRRGQHARPPHCRATHPTPPPPHPAPGSCTRQTPGRVRGGNSASWLHHQVGAARPSVRRRPATATAPAAAAAACYSTPPLQRTHDDAALDPQVVLLEQPHLDLLPALQKPENQVLRGGGASGGEGDGGSGGKWWQRPQGVPARSSPGGRCPQVSRPAIGPLHAWRAPHSLARSHRPPPVSRWVAS